VQKSLGLAGQPDPMLVGPAGQEDPTLREKKFNPTQPQMKKITITQFLYNIKKVSSIYFLFTI
jgi:hypothetical protein